MINKGGFCCLLLSECVVVDKSLSMVVVNGPN